MATDRTAVETAIHTTPNLDAAAQKLQASRKTLYNRMREFGLPPGQSGRPRLPLQLTERGTATMVIVGAVGVLGLGLGLWLLLRKKREKKTIVGYATDDYDGLELYGI